MSSADESGRITALLHAHHEGDREAFNRLVPLVYDRMRRIARGQLARGRGEAMLDTTSLVHEAYVQLVEETGVEWQDRGHFYAVCARAMRRIVVDYARRRMAAKRGGGVPDVTLDGIQAGTREPLELVLAVDQAVDMLASFNERLARIVECRYFAELTEEQTAQALGLSLRTVQRDWTRARAWLAKELG
jgi:RNA polymerase sigma-70 factor (ECF subfamily)